MRVTDLDGYAMGCTEEEVPGSDGEQVKNSTNEKKNMATQTGQGLPTEVVRHRAEPRERTLTTGMTCLNPSPRPVIVRL